VSIMHPAMTAGPATAIASLAAAGAALLLVPGRYRGEPRDLSSADAAEAADAAASRRRVTGGTAVLVAGIVVGAFSLGGVHPVLVLVAAAAVVGVLRLVAAARRATAAAHRRQLVVDYCEALLGELLAGQPAARALERSGVVWPETEPVVAAARLGADVPTAFRRLAEAPGAEGLRRLAGAWQLSAATGSGLALAVEQVLETARVRQATDRLVQAELASARATARLVTVLPVVVLVAAQGVGARPWAFLFSTGAGVGCLAAGVALALLGLWWIDRIAASAAAGTH
jgi:tight adherence protein B